MAKAKINEGTSALVTLAALLAILATRFDLPPRADRRMHAEIGATLAKQAVDLLGPDRSVAVITRDTEAFPQPAIDLALDRFQKEIKRASGRIVSIQRIQVDPLRPVEAPPGDFYELIRRAPAGQVIVSFLGPPLLSEEEWARLGRIKPKIVAFCSSNVGEIIDLRRLFEVGFLHAALVSRPLASPPRDDGRKVAPTFNDLYMTVTARDSSRLPSSSASRL